MYKVIRRAVVAVGMALALLVPAAAASAGGPPMTSWAHGGTTITSYSYGTVNAGTTNTQTFTLTNSGGSATSALTITLSGSAAFTITADTCTHPRSLGPGKSCSVTVAYAPAASSQSDQATLTATSHKSAATATLTLLGASKASPTIDTATNPPFGPVGTPVADVAILVGGFTPTGTMTFRLYSAPDCSGQVFSTTVPVDGQGQYPSASFTTTAAGTYYWVASYSGDYRNAPVTSPCNHEPVNIILGSPTIDTATNPPFGPVGTPVADVAILVGGFTPTGTMTFRLYSAPDCSGQVFSTTVPVDGQGQYPSASFTTTAVGTYYWVASYSGDYRNAPVTSPCNHEPVIITSS